MFLKYFKVFLLFLLPLSSFSQAKIWTLRETLNYAKEHNLTLQLARLNILRNEALLKQSKFDRLPNLNADATHNYNFGRSVDPTTYTFNTGSIVTTSLGLNSSVTIFNGFRKTNIIRQREHDLLSSQYAVEETFNDLALTIVQYYMEALLSADQLEIAQQQLFLTQNQLENTQKLIEAGSVPEGNILEIQAQLANDRLSEINAQNQLELALLNLQLMLNLQPTPDFAVEVPDFTDEDIDASLLPLPANVYDQAINSQSSIKRAETNLLSAEEGIDVAKGNYYPSLTLFGSLGSTYSNARKDVIVVPAGFDTIGAVANTGDFVITPGFATEVNDFPFRDQIDENFNQNIGINLNIPIFNRWQSRSSVELAKIDYQSAQLNLEQEKSTLKTEIYQAYANAVSAAQAFQAAQENLTANQKAFDYAQRKYEEGIIRPMDYFIAQNTLQVAKLNLARAKYQFILTKKILELYQDNTILK